jgi:hypothetical protein
LRRTERIFEGKPVGIQYSAGLRDTAGNPAHAATSIPARLIILDAELKKKPRGHNRILLHECFHFVWVRLGNPVRWSWEKHLVEEKETGARGEAGWSAEWRKKNLSASDVRGRTIAWREYCCESFCDTAAWIVGGMVAENTLGVARRRSRIAWFEVHFKDRPFRI